MSTPPDPLPKWLPPGTAAPYSSYTCVAKTPAELRRVRGEQGYWAVWEGSNVERETFSKPDEIDWENIPDTGPHGFVEVHGETVLYVPAKGEFVRVVDISMDTHPVHTLGDVVKVHDVSVEWGDAEPSRTCLLLGSEEEHDPPRSLRSYCLVEPLFEAPLAKKPEPKGFDPEAWEQARAEAEAAFGGTPAVEGPSGVMMVNGQAYELKNCQVQIDDYFVTSDPDVYASLEDAVRAKGFVPGDLLIVDGDYSLQPAPLNQVGKARQAIPAGALVAMDPSGYLVPAKASKVGPVTKRRKP